MSPSKANMAADIRTHSGVLILLNLAKNKSLLSHLSIPVCQHKLNCLLISAILQANDSSTPPRAKDEAEQAKIKLEP